MSAMLVSLMVVLPAVSARADGLYGEVTGGLATEVVKTVREGINNNSYGGPDMSQPPIRTFSAGGDINLGGSGIAGGFVVRRTVLAFNGSVATIEMFGMTLQNNLATYALLGAAFSRGVFHTNVGTGGATNVALSAGGFIPGVNGLAVIITQETFIFDNGTIFTTYRVGLRVVSFGDRAGKH